MSDIYLCWCCWWGWTHRDVMTQLAKFYILHLIFDIFHFTFYILHFTFYISHSSFEWHLSLLMMGLNSSGRHGPTCKIAKLQNCNLQLQNWDCTKSWIVDVSMILMPTYHNPTQPSVLYFFTGLLCLWLNLIFLGWWKTWEHKWTSACE